MLKAKQMFLKCFCDKTVYAGLLILDPGFEIVCVKCVQFTLIINLIKK